MASFESESFYPLDKNRKLISERKDPDGATYKEFRLFSKGGDHIDIEVEIRQPTQTILPLDANRKIVAQEKSENGYITKLMMTENSGQIKEYWIEEKLSEVAPGNLKRPIEDSSNISTKKSKSTIAASDENIQNMIQHVAEKKDYPPSDAFLLMLAKTTVEEIDFSKKSKIISVSRQDSLPSAFKKLIENNILSLPVLNMDDTFYGFIDILDIVTFLIDLLGEETLTREDVNIYQIDAFQNATVSQVMVYPISKKNPFHPFPVGSSLLSAMETLASGAHRIPVVNADNKLVNILTQSSVLQFIQKNKHLLGEKEKMKLKDIFLSNQYVLSVNNTDKAIDAFRLIRLAKVGAVAVINEEGRLVGNCSARDLKRISNNSILLARLFEPLENYLKDRHELVIATKDESLGEVIDRIVKKKLHRIFILDGDCKPDGLLSLSDILEELLVKY